MAKPVANAKHSPKSMFITLLQNCTKKLVDYSIMKLESNLQNFFIERLAIFRNTKQLSSSFSAYMRHRQGKPRKAPGGLLSSGPRGRGCAGSPAHLDHRRSGRVNRTACSYIDCQHRLVDRQQQQVPIL